MEEIIGHKSSLLFLVLISYVCWRLSYYGKRKADQTAFKTTSLISLFLIASYFMSNIIPIMGVIGIAIILIVVLSVVLILPGPKYKLAIPENKQKSIFTELALISVLTFIAIGVWQRVA